VLIVRLALAHLRRYQLVVPRQLVALHHLFLQLVAVRLIVAAAPVQRQVLLQLPVVPLMVVAAAVAAVAVQ
jgi:hypothetical protein